MNPDGPVQIVFPPHVGEAITALNIALFMASALAVWLIVDWLNAPKTPKKRK